MPVHVVRLGSPRSPDEGLRLGTVRRPPRGVKKADWARRDFYDVWLPTLAPSEELLKRARPRGRAGAAGDELGTVRAATTDANAAARAAGLRRGFGPTAAPNRPAAACARRCGRHCQDSAWTGRSGSLRLAGSARELLEEEVKDLRDMIGLERAGHAPAHDEVGGF